MALTPCPTCGLPRAVADCEADAPCPVCGRRPSEPPPVEVEALPVAAVRPPDPPAPLPPADSGLRNVLLVGGALVAGLAVLVAMIVWPDGSAPVPPDPLPLPVPVVAVAPVVPPVPGLEVAPPPRPADIVSAAEPEGSAVEVLPPPRPTLLPGGVSVLRFDRLGKNLHLPRIGEGNRLKVVGRVDELTVDGVDGGATLDLTELQANRIAFHGAITDGATVLVRKVGGAVSFGEGIGGGATVVVDAPDGSVSFGGVGYKSKVQTRVDGGASVAITARSVTINAVVAGPDTRVRVTFTPAVLTRLPTTLTFHRVEDRARLLYRTRNPADKPVRVEPGVLATGGECRPGE